MRPSLLASFILAFSARALLGSPSEEPLTLRWTLNGLEREALVFTPEARTREAPAPLVFAFHGHGGNMQGAAKAMGFQKVWPEALVVYMQGIATPSLVDPRGLWRGWQREPGQFGDRDLRFVDAALATLRQKYRVDDSRVYATGFSNGAFFTYLLWAERPGIFAAFAPCAGLIGGNLRLSEPRPLLHIAGERDELVRFADQEETMARARRINGATERANPCGPGCTVYASTKGTPVVTVIHPGGHIFPPEASLRIVKFFQEHALER